MRTATIPVPAPGVLAAVAAGARRPRDIAVWTQRPQHALTAEIGRELLAGRLTRTWYGTYNLTTAGRDHVLALLGAATQPAAPAFDPTTATRPERRHHQVAPSVLPGSGLTDYHQHGYAEEYVLALNAAEHTVEDALRRQPRIAAALQRRVEQVIVECHPGKVDSLALLQLIGDDSPLYGMIDHPGPAAFDRTTGQVSIGWYADGTPVTWPLWTERGARHGAVTGSTGTGSSSILRGLLAAVAGCDLVTAHAVDTSGVGGLSGTGQPTAVTREEAAELQQVSPSTADGLRAAKKAKISDARGKGRTSRRVFPSADARAALADYLEQERPVDAGEASTALFLSASSVGSRRPDGRLSPRSVNTVCEQIGRWHDAEHSDPVRHISPLRPHDLRHTFGFTLAAVTGNDAYELQRRLGHQSQRYINRYTNPPEDIAAGYIEGL